MRRDHAALVLGAGAGRRLGRSKQLLMRDGEPLLRRAARIALQTAPSRCVVVLGADADALTQVLQGLDVEILRHADWSAGMGSSLAALRQHVQDDTALRRSLILGCDQAALDAPHLRALLDEADRATSGCATSGYAGVRGIPAVVTHSAWADVPLQADSGLRGLFASLDVQTLGCVSAPALALDIDTPADLAAAQQRGWVDAE
ncbi:nucleotidyltransferase family protein [Xanthomonas nasturtii]|uniref:Nucleotidyltransferase family protein n=1 Tax=Xanthomonas nasturtii TaxID=1843581 RepID=A0A3E1KNE6_9XANT|nr:nucleotidyltransferase family protein [Xanthomonas nasturtii]MCL1498666.1 nucleotidyltransferase family protein [Xanthomonas nasturtii]MCL1528152.1 nucleotidyltransferase family protein [Xanthomonas nasturtii]MCL1530196.1 nucleotidyltransferase family protein [Xanthomonas nasturtii]MCL1535710.1 nucleotidyltransferase family protein [Xanthomonas nasturtii]MCL1545073.1 nucleotidyltransferase family protein [Xanthomonas nasturtii]